MEKSACGGGWYLQKTLPGGIMLVELRFREVFFCVSVYAYEWRRPASDGRKINAQVLSCSRLTLTLTLVAAARVSRQKDQRTGSVM